MFKNMEKINNLPYCKKYNICMFLTFVFLIAYQVFFNRNEIVPRSLPDELGALAVSAKLAGYDWSYVLSQAGMYYGFGSTLFLFPLIKYVNNPLVLYQFLLAGGALLRTIPVFICFKIAYKFFNIKNLWLLSLMSVIGILGTPTRSTNIDNEPMLILIGWVIVLCLFEIQENGKKEILYWIILYFSLAFATLVHERAYILILCAAMVLLLKIVLDKRLNVGCVLGCGGFVVIFTIGKIIKSYVQANIYCAINDGGIKTNTATLVAKSSLELFMSNISDNIQDAISLLVSNSVVAYTFSICIIPLSFIILIKITIGYFRTSKREKIDVYYIPCLYAVLVTIVSLCALSVVWCWSATNVRLDGADLSRGHFYLRYFGSMFGPLTFLTLCLIHERKIGIKEYLVVLFSYTILSKFTIIDSIKVAVDNGKKHGDWFGYFAPFSLTGAEYDYNQQDEGYYIMAIVIILLIFFIVYLTIKNNHISICFSIIAVVFLYQYAYSTIKWDRPYSNGEYYYESVNGIIDLKEKNNVFFNGVDSVCYYGKINGPQFIMQFVLKDVHLNLSLPQDKSSIIIVNGTTKDLEEIDGLDNEYVAFMIDKNEYIITNSQAKIDWLTDYYRIVD